LGFPFALAYGTFFFNPALGAAFRAFIIVAIVFMRVALADMAGYAYPAGAAAPDAFPDFSLVILVFPPKVFEFLSSNRGGRS